MVSQAQLIANRRNALKSTGPRTSRGKATVSQNPVKHGLTAQPVLSSSKGQDVISSESQAEFDLYRQQSLQESSGRLGTPGDPLTA